MGRFLLRRLASAVPILLAVAVAVFVLVDLAPGSPLDRVLGDRPVSPEIRERLEAAWGASRPASERLLSWLADAATRGDLGWSVSRGAPVSRVLGGALPATLALGASALAVLLLTGVGIGVLGARRPGGAIDRTLGTTTLVLYALPTFWLAVMAILLFAVLLPVFPASSSRSVGSEAWPALRRGADLAWHVALPALVLGVGSAAGLARHVRGAMARAVAGRSATAARARGAGGTRVLFVHAFRNALAPVAAVTGLSLPFLVSGSLVVEVVFGWPGMGRIAYEAVLAEDLPLLAASTLLSAALVVAGNLAADLLLLASDPRVRAGEIGSRT